MGADPGDEHDWLDDEAGPLVRSYALTGGRARPGSTMFDLLTHVVATPETTYKSPIHLQPEHRAILDRARNPVSVAELASHLGLGLGVVRVLLSDLVTAHAITKVDSHGVTHLPADHILKAVLKGLRND